MNNYHIVVYYKNSYQCFLAPASDYLWMRVCGQMVVHEDAMIYTRPGRREA